jgi:hypothetical protein
MSALPALLAIMIEPEPEPVKPRALVAPPVKRMPKVAEKQRPVPISTSAAPSEVKPPSRTDFRDEPLPGSSPVLPEDRRFMHCTWPVKEDGVHKLCAEERVPRQDGRLGNYCAIHARRSARRTDLIGEAFVKSTLRWATR